MTANQHPTPAPGRHGNPVLVGVATLLGQGTLVLATLVGGLLACFVGWLPPRGDWTFRISKVWSWLLLRGGLIRLRNHHHVALDPKQSYVFMANHQSLYDIPALILSLPVQTRFLAKRSLFRIPIFGWALTAGGFVPVDRGDRARSRETFTAALERLRAGKSIAIFPEETRSLDGRLLPFKRGGILLALRSGFPIVPVAIQGTLAVQPKTSFLIRPGTVDIHFGAPIVTEGVAIRQRAAIEAEVRAAIESLYPGAQP